MIDFKLDPTNISTEKYSIKTQQEARLERDSIDGNINRMFVTDDPAELLAMKNWAVSRLELLYDFHLKRLASKVDSFGMRLPPPTR